MFRHLRHTSEYIPTILARRTLPILPRAAITKTFHRRYSDVVGAYAYEEVEDYQPFKKYLFHQDLRDSGPLWRISSFSTINTNDNDFPRMTYLQDNRDHGPLYNKNKNTTASSSTSTKHHPNEEYTIFEGVVPNNDDNNNTNIPPNIPQTLKYGNNTYEVDLVFGVTRDGKIPNLSDEVVESLKELQCRRVIMEHVEGLIFPKYFYFYGANGEKLDIVIWGVVVVDEEEERCILFFR